MILNSGDSPHSLVHLMEAFSLFYITVNKIVKTRKLKSINNILQKCRSVTRTRG